jgi:hypothetical protein
MHHSTKLSKFQTQSKRKLPTCVIEYITVNGSIDSQKTRHLYSLAGITAPTDDRDLLQSVFQNAKLLIAFEEHGGQHLLAMPAKAPRSPRRRSPKKKA